MNRGSRGSAQNCADTVTAALDDIRCYEIQDRHFNISSEDRHDHECTMLHVLFALRF